MHALGWTRDRAINYMKENTGLTEQNIVVEVDRYIAWPGQAVSYKIGELKFRELRRQPEAELGTRFNVREFHHVVLRNGPMSFELLTREVQAYIAERKRQDSSQP